MTGEKKKKLSFASPSLTMRVAGYGCFILLMMISMPEITVAWLCGARSSCHCFSDLTVRCDGVARAPLFRYEARNARSLVIKLNQDNDFDLGSLELTYGFSRTVILGARDDFCEQVAFQFPWVICMVDTVTRGSVIDVMTPHDEFTTTSSPLQLTEHVNEQLPSPPTATTLDETTDETSAADDPLTSAGPTKLPEGSWVDSPSSFWLAVTGGFTVGGLLSVISLAYCVWVKTGNGRKCNSLFCEYLFAWCLMPFKCCNRRDARRRHERYSARRVSSNESVVIYPTPEATPDV